MDMRAAIAEFMYSRDLSPASKLWYRARLGEFADWLASDGTVQVEAITPGQVRAYLAHAHDHPTPKGNARDSHTLHGYARALRAFLRWAASEGLVPATLPKKVVMPRMVAKVLPVLTKAQTDAMLDACITARDRAILAVLLDTGIRAAELTGLTLDRVHFSADDAYLVVHGKGRKQCEVGLGRRSRMLLHKYIYRYRRGADHGPVFVARGSVDYERTGPGALPPAGPGATGQGPGVRTRLAAHLRLPLHRRRGRPLPTGSADGSLDGDRHARLPVRLLRA